MSNYYVVSTTLVGIGSLLLITFLTRKKFQRLREQYSKWKDIKELEDDYDVYVSDEYAYHITDMRVQMEQLQNIEKYGMDSIGVRTTFLSIDNSGENG